VLDVPVHAEVRAVTALRRSVVAQASRHLGGSLHYCASLLTKCITLPVALECLQEPEEAYDRITELCKRLFKVSCWQLAGAV
jgi:hypothetical protein